MDTRSLEYNVIVVKWGDKFTAEHVNRIYRMAKKNITLPFNFYCYTEDPTDIYDEVNIIPLDESLDLEKWWWKLTLFKENNWSEGINLFLDLDVVIQKNIDHLFKKAKENKITLICDNEDFSLEKIFQNADPLTAPAYNSSVMIWYNNQLTNIFNKFIENSNLYKKMYLGIDRFFTYEIKDCFFNDIGEEEYYYRIGLENKEDLDLYDSQSIRFPVFNKNGKKIKSQSVRAFCDPNKSICVFNGCHEDHFYSGMENFLL